MTLELAAHLVFVQILITHGKECQACVFSSSSTIVRDTRLSASRSSQYTEATNRKSSTVRSYDSFTPTHHRTVSQLEHPLLLHYPPLNRQYSRNPPAR